LAVLPAIVFLGCAAQKVPITDSSFEPYKFSAKDYVQKVDNFLVILDASTSMSDKYKDSIKLNLARDTASKMNQTIPELAFKAGLRTFGQGECLPRGTTSLIYGMTPFAKADLGDALNKVKCTGGNSPLDDAIEASGPDISKLAGKTALLIFSDGLQMEDAPVASGALKKAMGDNLCIYTIQIGDSPVGKKLLEQVAKDGGCGFSVNADDISSAAGMADFVEKVFLQKAAVKDSDGDGVPDDRDKCPNTPKGVKVDADGCPIKVAPAPGVVDSDGDGVPDNLDQCPGTPAGAKVDERGCWVIKGVWFDFDKAIVKKEYARTLEEVAAVLKANPALKIALEGHTCNVGTPEYNQKLSERRAKAVKKYLEGLGVSAQNLSTKGYGLTKPCSSNKTKDGRAKNRRVELTPVK
ncbi:MAG: cell envelope biogenesis protein OmpA, partial [Desulfobacteraceae bacterium]